MRPFWHPLSALFLAEPLTFATPTVLRMLLDSEGALELRYAGDRMWPSVAHGARMVLRPMGGSSVRAGDVVVACSRGIPDLLRVESFARGELRLVADSDPEGGVRVSESGVLARAEAPRRHAGWGLRTTRRLRLDLWEALGAGPDPVEDPAGTVREKYDAQAPFYAQVDAEEIEGALLERIRRHVPAGGRVLIAGSGSGRECFALASEGWRVRGVDFAPSMVALAQKETVRRSSRAEFVLADLRTHEESPASLDAVVFTYDVYSFLPDREDRVGLLRRVRGWLRPGGVAFLSARRVRSAYEGLILTLQLAARRRRAAAPWGASHTRWLTPQGGLRRSFVHVFSDHALRAEVLSGGFELRSWRGGHGLLFPREDRAGA